MYGQRDKLGGVNRFIDRWKVATKIKFTDRWRVEKIEKNR
jgi:hypothetical protein